MIDVLVLATVLPRARRAGGDVGTGYFLDALRKTGAHVSVLGYDRPGERVAPVPWEIRAGERVIETSEAGPRAPLWYASSLVAGRGYSQQKFVSHAYRAKLRQALSDRPPTLVVIDKAQAGWAAANVPPHVPLVYIAHNVESDLYADQAADSTLSPRALAYRREARHMLRAERHLVHRAVTTWTFGRHDAQVLRRRFPGARVVGFVPVAAPVASPARTEEPLRDVGLLGTWSWKANRLGLEWFVEHVVPQLDPARKIEVAGIGADWLTGHGAVRYLGRVPDATEFVRCSRVMALATRAGSGIQMKALAAIGLGAQIVATPGAVAGLGRLPSFVDTHDDPAAFARAIERRVRQPPDDAVCRNDGAVWIARAADEFDAAIERELELVLGAPVPTSANRDTAFDSGASATR
jgi:hypothetical protein